MSDVYRSRRGRLAGPPVGALTVTPHGTDDGTDLLRRVGDLLGPVLDQAPVPVVRDPHRVTVLLAMVDPVDVGRAEAVLRDGLASAEVSRSDLGLADLVRLGPLAGRLQSIGLGGPSD